METLEYKLFPAIEFCVEVPRDGQRRESRYSKLPKLVAQRYERYTEPRRRSHRVFADHNPWMPIKILDSRPGD